jgi:hypothetical protein
MVMAWVMSGALRARHQSGDERSRSLAHVDDAVALELAIRLYDRGRVHAQRAGERADRGQGIAGGQVA